MAFEIDRKSLSTPVASAQTTARRPVWRSMLRGFRGVCPRCGKGKLFCSYLKVSLECPCCQQALHHHRADDAPPYFTMFIVGHILVPLVFWVERTWQPDLSVHAALWLPLSILLTLWLLPRVKGAIVGLQWALRMHGFALSDEDSLLVDPSDLEQDSKHPNAGQPSSFA